jgi:putative endonuclease
MFHVYILLSKTTNKFYIGSTGNLDDRLTRHNNGRSKSTKTGMPWTIVYTEVFQTRSEAMIRETEIKSWKSHTRISQLINSTL